MNKSILTVTLNPALDRTIVLDDFKNGEEYVSTKEYLSAGGKGLNVARALKSFGAKVLATGILCGREGERIQSLLQQENIKADFLYTKGETRTNVTIINQKSNERTRVLSLGPKISKLDLEKFKIKYVKLLQQSSVVVLSGRNANGAPSSYYAELISLAHQAHVPCVLDTSGKSLLEGIKAQPFVVKPNQEEAEEVLKEKLNSIFKLKLALQFFHQCGAKIVLLSLGEKGVMGSNQNEILKIVPPKIKMCHDVGCGDAFLAGFIYFYEKTNSFKEALKFATASGAAHALNYKAGQIDLKNQKAILKKLKVQILH